MASQCFGKSFLHEVWSFIHFQQCLRASSEWTQTKSSELRSVQNQSAQIVRTAVRTGVQMEDNRASQSSWIQKRRDAPATPMAYRQYSRELKMCCVQKGLRVSASKECETLGLESMCSFDPGDDPVSFLLQFILMGTSFDRQLVILSIVFID